MFGLRNFSCKIDEELILMLFFVSLVDNLA